MGAGELVTSSLAPATEETFEGLHSRQIFFRRWLPAGAPRAVVTIAHGFGEHSGRYLHVAERLLSEGYAVYALDHHGHGRSDGPRGRISLADAVEDLDRLIVLEGERHPGVEPFLLGHSMGGAIALRYAIAHQDRLTGLILSGPLAAIEGRALEKSIGRALGAIAPGLPVAKINPDHVSRDPDVVRTYVEDPLVYHRPIPAGTVAEFLRHVDSLPDDVGAITLPTLLMYGTADKLAAPAGSVMVSQRISSSDLTTVPFEGLYHEIFNEPEQAQVLDQLVAWLAARVPAADVPAPAERD
jgi:acylglycerol lipase